MTPLKLSGLEGPLSCDSTEIVWVRGTVITYHVTPLKLSGLEGRLSCDSTEIKVK